MNVATKLGSYAAVLAVIATGAWISGAAAGPVSTPAERAVAQSGGHADMGGATAPAKHGAPAAGHGEGHDAAQSELPGGLAAAQSGYTLVPATTVLPTGRDQPFAFRIIGPDGKPVTGYEVKHEKLLHLIVVRRDTEAFQHVHPKLAANGTWTVPLDTRLPGSYRVFADFTPKGGQALTLGVDLTAPGDFQPRTHRPDRTAIVDGYQVTLDGELAPGSSSELELTVRRNGREVTDLQPYLGAYGHLVALRGGDLGYLHVHPDGHPGDGKTKAGPRIVFFAAAPSAGTYRLFLDFKHRGEVRTAEFTVTAGNAPATPAVPTESHSHADEQPHG